MLQAHSGPTEMVSFVPPTRSMIAEGRLLELPPLVDHDFN